VAIVEGPPVVDRRSTFQAFLATGVDSPEKVGRGAVSSTRVEGGSPRGRQPRRASREAPQVGWARRAILGRGKVARATHNMVAYRFVDAAGTRHSDNDDDGEDGAGAKMACVRASQNRISRRGNASLGTSSKSWTSTAPSCASRGGTAASTWAPRVPARDLLVPRGAGGASTRAEGFLTPRRPQDRFKHIAKCTQQILEANGLGKRAAPAKKGRGR